MLFIVVPYIVIYFSTLLAKNKPDVKRIGLISPTIIGIMLLYFGFMLFTSTGLDGLGYVVLTFYFLLHFIFTSLFYNIWIVERISEMPIWANAIIITIIILVFCFYVTLKMVEMYALLT